MWLYRPEHLTWVETHGCGPIKCLILAVFYHSMTRWPLQNYLRKNGESRKTLRVKSMVEKETWSDEKMRRKKGAWSGQVKWRARRQPGSGADYKDIDLASCNCWLTAKSTRLRRLCRLPCQGANPDGHMTTLREGLERTDTTMLFTPKLFNAALYVSICRSRPGYTRTASRGAPECP